MYIHNFLGSNLSLFWGVALIFHSYFIIFLNTLYQVFGSYRGSKEQDAVQASIWSANS